MTTTKAPETTVLTVCPEVTGTCTESDAKFQIPVTYLTRASTVQPSMDSLMAYSFFVELPMFNGGENGQTGSPLDKEGRIGTAHLAYNHVNDIVCVAASLDSSFLNDPETSSIQVGQSKEDSWIQFGDANGATKLFQGTADDFEYLGKADDSNLSLVTKAAGP
eukprot:CCRYP_013868-RA/>CCRYP_013868-RA protein AED:0.38 eAED:1.00 QI:0/0/0/1/1/1/2/0/162